MRAYRLKADFSQEELAEKAELSAVFISQVERGMENISVDSLARIAKALKVPIHRLLGKI